MRARKLTDDYWAGPQPTAEEFQAAADAGFKSVMVNRPEGEEPGQPIHAEEAEWAKNAGLDIAFVPLVPGQITPQLLEDFAREYDRLPKPIFAHCKGGPRSAMLWALNQRGKMGKEDILQAGQDAGFDLSPVAGAL